MKKMDRILSAILLASLCFAGCMKRNDIRSTPSGPSTQTDLVLTPGGLVSKSQVHFIGKGFQLARKNGHILKLKMGTSMIAEDLGAFTRSAVSKKSTIMTQGVPRSVDPGAVKPAGNPGWATYAQWTNSSSSPITNITANWIVPSIPASNDGQTIFLFNAVEVTAGTDIMQPVLQYGTSAAGNTGGWSIANWYVWLDNQGYTQYGVSDLLPVSPGTNLQGVITLVGQDPDGSFHYNSSFTGYSNALDIAEGDFYSTGSTAPHIDEQTAATITLETYQPGGYSVTQPSDYPAGQNFVDFTNIGASLGGSPASSSWIVDNNNTPFGESTVVIIDNTILPSFPPTNPPRIIPGQIRIYFHPAPLIDNTSRIGLSTSGPTASTITGYPGGQVFVTIEASATARSTSITTTTITTPGVTFTDGTTSYSVTRSNRVGTSGVTKSFIMPSGGSITVSSTYSSNNPSGPFLQLPGTVSVY